MKPVIPVGGPQDHSPSFVDGKTGVEQGADNEEQGCIAPPRTCHPALAKGQLGYSDGAMP